VNIKNQNIIVQYDDDDDDSRSYIRPLLQLEAVASVQYCKSKHKIQYDGYEDIKMLKIWPISGIQKQSQSTE